MLASSVVEHERACVCDVVGGGKNDSSKREKQIKSHFLIHTVKCGAVKAAAPVVRAKARISFIVCGLYLLICFLDSRK